MVENNYQIWNLLKNTHIEGGWQEGSWQRGEASIRVIGWLFGTMERCAGNMLGFSKVPSWKLPFCMCLRRNRVRV